MIQIPQKVFITIGVMLGVGLIGSAAAEPNMNPGMWETTVSVKMEGVPFQMPPFTSRYCITKEDLVPRTKNPGKECKIIDQKISGDMVRWHVRCDGRKRTTEMKGRITYKGNRFSGTMQTDFGRDGVKPMSQTITGKRIGKCK